MSQWNLSSNQPRRRQSSLFLNAFLQLLWISKWTSASPHGDQADQRALIDSLIGIDSIKLFVAYPWGVCAVAMLRQGRLRPAKLLECIRPHRFRPTGNAVAQVESNFWHCIRVRFPKCRRRTGEVVPCEKVGSRTSPRVHSTVRDYCNELLASRTMKSCCRLRRTRLLPDNWVAVKEIDLLIAPNRCFFRFNVFPCRVHSFPCACFISSVPWFLALFWTRARSLSFSLSPSPISRTATEDDFSTFIYLLFIRPTADQENSLPLLPTALTRRRPCHAYFSCRPNEFVRRDLLAVERNRNCSELFVRKRWQLFRCHTAHVQDKQDRPTQKQTKLVNTMMTRQICVYSETALSLWYEFDIRWYQFHATSADTRASFVQVLFGQNGFWMFNHFHTPNDRRWPNAFRCPLSDW